MTTKNAETTTTNRNDVRELTRAEIRRQVAIHSARRREIIEERAAHFRSHGAAMGASPAIGDDERAAREHAKSLLNGNAPESLSVPPALSRDRILNREERALDLVLKILADQDLAARAAESVSWAEEHGGEWRMLCREIILVAVRLEALEARARQLLGECVDLHAVRLPLANVIGGRPISETSLGELTETALREGVITSAEKRKAENV